MLIGTANLLYFSGITHINSYYQYYHYRPEEFSHYCKYVGRLGSILNHAERVYDIAVYYGIETIQSMYKPIHEAIAQQPAELWEMGSYYAALAKELYQKKSDFFFVDSEQIIHSQIDGNLMHISGSACSVLFMPNIEVLDLSVLEKLREFSNNGGMVVWCNRKPSIVAGPGECNTLGVTTCSFGVLIDDFSLKNILPPRSISVIEKARNADIYMGVYQYDGRPLFYLLNTQSHTVSCVVQTEIFRSGELLQPSDGSVKKISFPLEIDLNGYDSLFILAAY